MDETLMRLREASQSGAARALGVPTPADFTAAAPVLAATVVAVPAAPDVVARPLVAPLVDAARVAEPLLGTVAGPAAPVGAACGAVEERVLSGAAPSVAVAGCCCWVPPVLTDDVRWCWLL